LKKKERRRKNRIQDNNAVYIMPFINTELAASSLSNGNVIAEYLSMYN